MAAPQQTRPDMNSEKHRAAIGLGSNLNAPSRQLKIALRHLSTLPDTRIVAVSSFYRSSPQGPKDQPDYVNACAVLETGLTPHALLEALQTIEHRMGRQKQRHWGERVIDLDLLLYGNEMIQSPQLTVPHPWLHERDFVLIPLAEIAPEWIVPGLSRSVACLCNRLPPSSRFLLEKVCPPPSLS